MQNFGGLTRGIMWNGEFELRTRTAVCFVLFFSFSYLTISLHTPSFIVWRHFHARSRQKRNAKRRPLRKPFNTLTLICSFSYVLCDLSLKDVLYLMTYKDATKHFSKILIINNKPFGFHFFLSTLKYQWSGTSWTWPWLTIARPKKRYDNDILFRYYNVLLS